MKYLKHHPYVGPIIFLSIGLALIAFAVAGHVQYSQLPIDQQGEDIGPLIGDVGFGLPGITFTIPSLIILVKRVAQRKKGINI